MTGIRRILAPLALGLALAAGAAQAAEAWSPSAYLPSPIQGRGLVAGDLAPAPPEDGLDGWVTSPGRFLPSPIYGRGLLGAAAE